MKASTFLMFDGNARSALELYRRAFPQLQVESVTEHQIADGSTGIEQARVALAGHAIVLSDSSMEHDFNFTPSISMFIDFDSEAELESAFGILSAGGEILMPLDDYGFSQKFAWLTDPFGLSWQLNFP